MATSLSEKINILRLSEASDPGSEASKAS